MQSPCNTKYSALLSENRVMMTNQGPLWKKVLFGDLIGEWFRTAVLDKSTGAGREL